MTPNSIHTSTHTSQNTLCEKMADKKVPLLEEEIKEFRKKFPSLSLAEVKSTLKKVVNRNKYEDLAQNLDELLSNLPYDINITRFTKECKNAWSRKYPNGLEKKTRKVSKYQEFLSASLKELKQSFPDEKHSQRITRAAAMWKEIKSNAATEVVESDIQEDMDVEAHLEVDNEETVKRKKSSRKRRSVL